MLRERSHTLNLDVSWSFHSLSSPPARPVLFRGTEPAHAGGRCAGQRPPGQVFLLVEGLGHGRLAGGDADTVLPLRPGQPEYVLAASDHRPTRTTLSDLHALPRLWVSAGSTAGLSAIAGPTHRSGHTSMPTLLPLDPRLSPPLASGPAIPPARRALAAEPLPPDEPPPAAVLASGGGRREEAFSSAGRDRPSVVRTLGHPGPLVRKRSIRRARASGASSMGRCPLSTDSCQLGSRLRANRCCSPLGSPASWLVER